MFMHYYKSMFRSPSVVAALATLFVYVSLPFISGNALKFIGFTAITVAEKISLFQMNYSSFFFNYPAICIIIPMYALYVQYNRAHFQKESVIVRFDDRYLYWKRRIFCLLIDTVIFVLFIHLLLVLRLFLFSDSLEILKYALSYLLVIPLNIVGLLLFGLIFQFVHAITGKSAASFFSAYALAIYDFAAHQIDSPSIFVDRAFSFHIDYYNTNLMNMLIMLIALSVLILVFVFILVKRDYLIPKENKDAA